MRSYQIIDWGAPLEARDYPNPEPKGTEVLVRITASGMCHSDLHIWSGHFDLGNGKRLELEGRGVDRPFTMGHEIVGEVAAFGPDVDDVRLGDKRIVFPWIGCGDCPACHQEIESQCVAPRYLGARVHGGYSDHVMVPHPKYLLDYDGIPPALACTYACSGLTAYSALKKIATLAEDDYLLLIGAGGVGFNGIQFAPTLTEAKLMVADTDGTKRAAARQAGAAETIDNGEPGALKQVLKKTAGGVAAAIDFVGSPETFAFGLDALRRGGTLVVVGLFGGAASVSIPMLPFKSATVRGSYVGTLQEMHELMDLVKAGVVNPIPITPRPMAEINDALNDLQAGRVLGRVVFTP
jgi:D-arabinose 1-dehydrogenase-like Zn-dependent alcohol dehydrogenase